ncbi:MMPL family transporter [Pseudoflavonifractor sp. An184]|uniref:efflux RND transporter permease subunit n=1 Tax=Pseudoflavonifractor sp. An184 TaxID=1965576 RepID=UPI000B3A5FDE|nr:MMPL family transporter [Pseudoflavonifractor sp. An184]OUP54810.1 RND transporter [Pseudoflavonifractor sp. An184]
MSKDTGTTSFFEKLATFIVDKRNLIFFLYACALIFCLFSRNWVSVCNDITEYLPESTETRQGLTLMEEEFTTFATARVMVSHVTYEMAENLAEQMEQIEGVSSAAFGSSDVGADTEEDSEPETPEDIAEYFKGADALISVTFDGEEEDEISLAALSAIRELLEPYDFYIDSAVGNSQAASLANEMGIILAVAAVIIVLVLLLTSRSYAEIPVLLLTFVAAAVLNLGTNFIFGEISFVSNSVTVVLQLALAIDYAIIMLHRFLEEREYAGDREACIAAVSASIPSISASSLTTISGLAAMMFMQFQIGFDMGIVLIKAILFSMLSVFTLMPGLLMLFSKAMEKTQHRSFIPKIDRWGKLTLKLRYVGAPLFAVAVVAGFLLSNQCPYVYGYSQIETARQNETQIAEQRVNETFGTQNIMALLVPKGDYASEKALLNRLETYDQVDYAMGLSNVEVMDGYTLTDALTPRQFSEMTDLDYELVCLVYAAYAAEQEEYGRIVGGLDDYAVPLMDMFFFAYDKVEEGYVNLDEEQQADLDDLYVQLSDAQEQLLGENYTRMLVSLNLPEEGEETFAFLQTIHQEAERYYDAGSVYLVGDSTSDYDLSVSFARDNVMISVLSVVFVIIVLLFTFQSVGLPLLLILVIQGSIWINFSFPGITQQPIFFMSYLVVTSIQMGANIDYAIVISSWYNELKGRMSRREAVIQALNLSFPTVLTSGSILSAAGFLIGRITTEPAIVGIGECLCRGTLISMFLVMFILPQILFLGDQVVERTRFNLKVPEVGRTVHGTVYVNGRVRGRISGVVDAHIQGVIYGDVSGMLETGNYQNKEASKDNETEHQ